MSRCLVPQMTPESLMIARLEEATDAARVLAAQNARLPHRITYGIEELCAEILPGMTADEVRLAAKMAGVYTPRQGAKLCVLRSELPRLEAAAANVLSARRSRRNNGTTPRGKSAVNSESKNHERKN